jgi:hypothetical protein
MGLKVVVVKGREDSGLAMRISRDVVSCAGLNIEMSEIVESGEEVVYVSCFGCYASCWLLT